DPEGVVVGAEREPDDGAGLGVGELEGAGQQLLELAGGVGLGDEPGGERGGEGRACVGHEGEPTGATPGREAAYATGFLPSAPCTSVWWSSTGASGRPWRRSSTSSPPRPPCGPGSTPRSRRS